MPADLAQALSLVALIAATLQYVILMRHRQERRDATQLNRVATDTGLPRAGARLARVAVTADPATDRRRPRELAPFLDQPTALRAT